MKDLSKQALVLAALSFAFQCQSREPLASRKADDIIRIDNAVASRRGNDIDRNGMGHYATVNGLKLYYEIYLPIEPAGDSGEPLILLHGGIGSIEMFGTLLPPFSRTRMVITADIDRPLRFELMADDIATLIKHLRIKRADVMGYSLGGGVAMRTAIQHPDVVRKLVVVSEPQGSPFCPASPTTTCVLAPCCRRS